jgi:hypothetical protein
MVKLAILGSRCDHQILDTKPQSFTFARACQWARRPKRDLTPYGD